MTKENGISRRTFLKAVGAVLGLTSAGAVFKQENDKNEMRKQLRTKLSDAFELDIPNADANILNQFIYDHTFATQHKNWNTKKSFGFLPGSKGPMEITTDASGEQVFGLVPVNFIYPEASRADQVIKRTFNFGGKNRVHIYGPPVVQSIFSEEVVQNILTPFVGEYFGGIRNATNANNLHLNFYSSRTPVKYVNLENFNPPHTSPTWTITEYAGNGQSIVNLNVLFNFHMIHTLDDKRGYDVGTSLIEALANERTNLIARELSVNAENLRINSKPNTLDANEAPSTIAGCLAAIDDNVAKKILGGGGYQKLVELLVRLMSNLKERGNTRSNVEIPNKLSRRDLFKLKTYQSIFPPAKYEVRIEGPRSIVYQTKGGTAPFSQLPLAA